jgi:hypothetical protein
MGSWHAKYISVEYRNRKDTTETKHKGGTRMNDKKRILDNTHPSLIGATHLHRK